jgi:hypothetical protein
LVPATALFAVNEVCCPSHIVAGVAVAVKTGFGFTVTVTVSVEVHPAGVNPTIVYVVVAAGVIVTGEPINESGNHPNWVNGILLVTVKVVEAPSHIAAGVAVGVNTGVGFTVTVTVVDPVQPAVPVTVYVVVIVGFSVTVCPFKLPGIQLN